VTTCNFSEDCTRHSKLGAGRSGLLPEFSAVEPTVGQHEHAGFDTGQQWAGEFALIDENATEVCVDHGMGTAFAQAEYFDLRVGGVQAQADTATELVFDVGGVRDVELYAVDGHHPQIPEPGARGARPGRRPGHPCVELADRLGAQAGPGLTQR